MPYRGEYKVRELLAAASDQDLQDTRVSGRADLRARLEAGDDKEFRKSLHLWVLVLNEIYSRKRDTLS